MQRVEPRELLAAGFAALAPTLWLAAVLRGLAPDVLDSDASAAFIVGVSRLRHGDLFLPASPLATLLAAGSGLGLVWAARLIFGAALWSAGYGGWRFARTFAPEAGGLPGLLLGISAQLGPWTLAPLGLGSVVPPNITALAAGPVLLGLAHPWFGVCLGCWSPAAAVVISFGGLFRKKWRAALGLVGLLPLLGSPSWGGAYPGDGATRTAPSYAGSGVGGGPVAWFPLPPAESARWNAASAWYGGRWVHPLSSAVSGRGGDTRPTTALPLAVEAASVPEAPTTVSPSIWAAAQLPEGRARAWLRGSGLESGVVPFGVALLGCAFVAISRRRTLLVIVTVVSAVGGVGASRPAGSGPAKVSTAELVVLAPELRGQSAVLFPPPEAPYLAGRCSDWQIAALLELSGATGGDSSRIDLATIARITGYGLDTQAAQVLTESPPKPRLGEPDTLLIVDTAALPPWTWVELQHAFSAAGVIVSGEGTFRVVRFGAPD